MAKVAMKTVVKTSPEQLWETIRDFNGLAKFVEAVASSTQEGSGVGALRTLTLQDGGVIVEKLESLDDGARSLTYSIVDSPLPVAEYLSRMQVSRGAAGESTLEWSSTFAPKGVSEQEAVQVIEGIYSMGFDGLKKLYGG